MRNNEFNTAANTAENQRGTFSEVQQPALDLNYTEGNFGCNYPECSTESHEEDTYKERDFVKAISIGGHRIKELCYPIDKVNSTIWTQEETEGTVSLKAEPNTSDKEISFLFSLDFSTPKITENISKKLTQYGKRVYMAAGALWQGGNEYFSLTQLYHAMGGTGRPGSYDMKKLNEELTRLHAIIHLDNEEEVKANFNYQKFVYDGPLLPFERVSKIAINGKVTEAAVHLFREPPLITFAKERKQITTIPLKALQAPLSNTEKNLALQDYILTRITRKGTQPILLETVYRKAEITNKTRAKEVIKKALEQCKVAGIINSYKLLKDRITYTK